MKTPNVPVWLETFSHSSPLRVTLCLRHAVNSIQRGCPLKCVKRAWKKRNEHNEQHATFGSKRVLLEKHCHFFLFKFSLDWKFCVHQGSTPLHDAAFGGHADVVTLLLEAKARVILINNDRRGAQTPGYTIEFCNVIQHDTTCYA